jgi:nicotinate-nucleotide pyrophosphorylase (carboxylating)
MGLGKAEILDIVRFALKEDIGVGDITTSAIFVGTEPGNAKILSKEEGVFCAGGLPTYIYAELDPSVKIKYFIEDGMPIQKGDIALELRGPAALLLTGERVMLNFLQRMCGIATATAKAVDALKGTGITVLDTRKTSPGLRAIDKYSVRMGGGHNHRFGLFDMVMIKDNHIKAAGGIIPAVEAVRRVHGSRYKIEVEATCEEEVRQALDAGVDIIMLDNMDVPTMSACVRLIGNRAKTEISGNITAEKLPELKKLGVTYISMGALTHSVKAFDLSMQFE